MIEMWMLVTTVTTGNRLVGNKGIDLVTVGEATGNPERRVVGQDGLATQIARSMRSNQERCYDEPKCTIPPGDPERGEEILNRMDLTEMNRNAQTTLSRCICGKTCKNQRGLKIHQSRMKCLEGGNREQSAGTSPGRTEEVQGQESYHSTQSLQASVPLTLGKESRKKIKWPPANKGAWQDFDNDICEIIQSATKGDVERRLSFMTTIITSLASERFGYVETRQPRRLYTANRRVNKMKDLRKEIRSLKKLYRRASIEERQPLEELREYSEGNWKPYGERSSTGGEGKKDQRSGQISCLISSALQEHY